MSKLSFIIQGWKNYVFKDVNVEESAKRKAEICAGCDEATMSVWDDVLPDATLVEVKGMKCSVCDCPLSTLLRSEKKCELGKF